MSPYSKAGLWFTRISLPDKRSRVVSCGTSDKVVAAAVEAMVRRLAAKRQWAPLVAVVDKVVTLPKLYDAYELGELDAFMRRLTDADLSALLDEWKATGADATYVRQIRQMIPAGTRYAASDFTRKAVSRFLASLKVSGSTKNRYRAALSVFARWLVEREVLDHNPVRDVRGAKENAPRDKWLTIAQAQAVCEAAPQPYRALFALLYGAGVEISAALTVTPRDIDYPNETVHVRGTKTAWRNRVVVVDRWAFKHVARITTFPGETLFGPITYMMAYHAHRAALEAVQLTGYTLHDARHSYAVNALKAGLRPEVVARQLGHKDATLVNKVYGRYVPSPSDYVLPQTLRVESGGIR